MIRDNAVGTAQIVLAPAVPVFGTPARLRLRDGDAVSVELDRRELEELRDCIEEILR